MKESKKEQIKIANFLALKEPPEPGSRKRITSKLSSNFETRNLVQNPSTIISIGS